MLPRSRAGFCRPRTVLRRPRAPLLHGTEQAIEAQEQRLAAVDADDLGGAILARRAEALRGDAPPCAPDEDPDRRAAGVRARDPAPASARIGREGGIAE